MARSGIGAIYAAGFFSLSYMQMLALATPLWGSHLGLSVAMIGLAAAARFMSSFIYSMHFGALMDSIGTRRFLVAFSAQCALLPLLYPLLPFTVPFLVIQLVLGLAAGTVWLAAQVAIARVARGESRKTGRFSLFTASGLVAGPLIIGYAWDKFGHFGGFATLVLWGSGLFVASLLLPREQDPRSRKMNMRILIPDLRSYFASLSELTRPLIAFVILCTFIRLASMSMLETFYPLLLQTAGSSLAVIGVLFAIGNLASTPSSLLAVWWERVWGSSRRGLTLSTVLTVLPVVVLPFVHDFWSRALLFSIYGFGLGLSMPLMLTLLSQGAGAHQQGSVAGLRAAANRLAAITLPLLMGVVAEILGLAYAFVVLGLGLLATLLIAEVLFVKWQLSKKER